MLTVKVVAVQSTMDISIYSNSSSFSGGLCGGRNFSSLLPDQLGASIASQANIDVYANSCMLAFNLIF